MEKKLRSTILECPMAEGSLSFAFESAVSQIVESMCAWVIYSASCLLDTGHGICSKRCLYRVMSESKALMAFFRGASPGKVKAVRDQSSWDSRRVGASLPACLNE